MNAVRLLILILCALTFVLGCSREVKKKTSSIVIQAPPAGDPLTKTGGVGALAAMPTDRKVCYGINVTGPGIIINAPNSCSIKSGLLVGFVEPGSTVSVNVPKGSSRKVELFAYLQAVGTNLPCPLLGPALPADLLGSTYLVGVAEGIELSDQEVVVTITASFPGMAQNIAQTFAMPSTCASNSTKISGASVASAAGVAIGTGMKLMYRVGAVPGRQTLTGTGMKLLVK